MAFQRDSILGYGFLLVGVAVPPLIDNLFGHKAGLIAYAVCFVIGVIFLIAAHHDQLPQRRSLKMAIFIFTLYGAVIGALGGGLTGAVASMRKVETKERDDHKNLTKQVESASSETKADDKNKENSPKTSSKNEQLIHANTKSPPDEKYAVPPGGVVAQPRSVVSIGQQGGITAAQVIISDDSLVPTKIQCTQASVLPPRPNLFPYALQITIKPNKRIDAPNLALFFDGPVEIPDYSGMDLHTGRINDTNGPNDPNTVWIFWTMPPLTPEKPAVMTIESLHEVHLLSVSKGPKAPF
jgi:hypothetical protein